jgi:hypothetical protein
MKFTNTTGIPPLLAGWLSIDEYDYSKEDKTISTTTLMKPIRQMILSKRYKALPSAQIDVSTLVASSVGTAVHDSIERIWKSHLPQILLNLNIPNALHSKYVINPTELKKGDRPVYLENRRARKVGEWTVSGKYDAVLDGQLNDFKFTKTYSYMSESKGEDYAIQGSVYRWLNPDIVTNDYIKINFIFGDFDKKETYRTGYPPAPAAYKEYQLYESDDTEQWISERITEINRCMDLPEADLPECTPEELWMAPSTFKYYKNPENRKRSTGNFDTFDEALSRKVADGNVGVVVEIQGEPKACVHCEGAALCKQKDKYIAQGILKL